MRSQAGKKMENLSIRISRPKHLAPKVVFVDGIDGCGKTMLAPIVAAMDRVELLTYAYEVEYVCALRHLGKIDADAAAATISLLADLQLYNTMQSREINFRPGDLSSAFRFIRPMRYLRRLFEKGDAHAIERIAAENPILLLTTHRLSAYGWPVFEALGSRVVLVEVVRHPLYMIIQSARNFSGIIGTVRDFSIYYDHRGGNLPFFAYGWEDTYLAASEIDRMIHYLAHVTTMSCTMREKVRTAAGGSIVTIPFEKFVVAPDTYMRTLESALGSRATRDTLRMLKKQKVPRQKYAESIDLDIYRRCGWEPPKVGLTEREEFGWRRKWIAAQASTSAMRVLDRLCDDYEAEWLGEVLRTPGGKYL